MRCLLPPQPEAAHPCKEHSCLWHLFGVMLGDTARGCNGGTMGQVLNELSPPLLQGHSETPMPSKQQRGQKAQHFPWDTASRVAGADKTLCQGSSSTGGDGKGQPVKVLAPLQAQPWA